MISKSYKPQLNQLGQNKNVELQAELKEAQLKTNEMKSLEISKDKFPRAVRAAQKGY